MSFAMAHSHTHTLANALHICDLLPCVCCCYLYCQLMLTWQKHWKRFEACNNPQTLSWRNWIGWCNHKANWVTFWAKICLCLPHELRVTKQHVQRKVNHFSLSPSLSLALAFWSNDGIAYTHIQTHKSVITLIFMCKVYQKFLIGMI